MFTVYTYRKWSGWVSLWHTWSWPLGSRQLCWQRPAFPERHGVRGFACIPCIQLCYKFSLCHWHIHCNKTLKINTISFHKLLKPFMFNFPPKPNIRMLFHHITCEVSAWNASIVWFYHFVKKCGRVSLWWESPTPQKCPILLAWKRKLSNETVARIKKTYLHFFLAINYIFFLMIDTDKHIHDR